MLWRIRKFLENFIDNSLFLIGCYTCGAPQLILHNLNFKLPSRQHILLFTLGSKLSGTAVEVGVFQGKFSKMILENTKLEKLFSIDPWKEFEIDKYFDLANEQQNIHEERYLETKKKLKIYSKRSEIIRATSLEAVSTFKDQSLDFIYIDANHSYEACLQDLQLWWPKLKKGGLIAGDDYTNTDNGVTKYGVKQAVDEFFRAENYTVFITYKSYSVHWPNWYVLKNH